MSQTNIAVVKGIYEAFVRGDIQHILHQVSDKVKWLNPGAPTVPYAGERHNRAEVGEFFAKLPASVDVLGFEAREYTANEDQVAATGMFKARAKSTGKTYGYEWSMWWRLQNGKVIEYRSYPDTAAEAAGFAKSASA